jgi:spermidine synthase
MGATLPMATALLVRSGEVTARVGLLYGINTLGGVAGCGFAGFLLVPELGMSLTGWVAVGLNVTAALLALSFASPARDAVPAAPQGEAAASPADRRQAIVYTAVYALSGFASLTLEVAWARLVGLSIGSTTYGFTIILLTYIAGIGFGSLLLPRLRFLAARPVRGLFLLHAVIALGSVLALGYLGSLPLYVFRVATDSSSTAADTLMREAVLVFSTIVIPTLAMGGAYPLVVTLLHRLAGNTGAAAGIAYASNTAGNIAGSLLAGFVLVPWIGMRSTIVVAAVLSALAGVSFLLHEERGRPRAVAIRAALLAAALVLATVSAPDWHQGLITSAPYAASKVPGEKAGERAPMVASLVEYREGASSVLTVTSEQGGLVLRQDGLAQAGTHGPFQRLLGHLPLVLHRDPKRVLLVGLGAGHTLDAVLTHPVEQVECVEISAEVRDAAHYYFHGRAIDNPRAYVHIGDGRNHLRHTRLLYDVIISHPSQAWLSGAAGLFTREYFQEVRNRLAPGGVATSWFFTYTAASRRSIVAAFSEVFPHAFLFDIQGQPTVLVGLRDDARLSVANIRKHLEVPEVRQDLKALGFGDAADVLGGFIAGGERLRGLRGDEPVSTDDNGYVAFHGLGDGVFEPLDALLQLREDPAPYIDATLATTEETAAFNARLAEVRRQRVAGFDPSKLKFGGR